MRPEDVVSPRARTRNHAILYKSTIDENGAGWSICEAEVRQTNDEDDDDWERMIGFRWDGVRSDASDRGFPNTSGQGIWCWLPDDLADYFVGRNGIVADLKEKRERKKAKARERSIEQMLQALTHTVPSN